MEKKPIKVNQISQIATHENESMKGRRRREGTGEAYEVAVAVGYHRTQ